MKKMMLALSAAAVAMPVISVPAEAHNGRHFNGGHSHQARYYQTDNGIRYWRGDNGRYYCKRKNGTTGLLIGGVAGALIGRSIDTRGDRAVGTVLGAAGGALLGREVDRGRARCR